MTIEEMRKRKQEKGYSYEQISELSGVPLGTIQKIFCGETQNPRYDTLMALEKFFSDSRFVGEPETIYHYDRQGSYTIDDYMALPDEQRVELIDGCFYDMSAPTKLHQRIAGEVYRQIANYLYENDKPCQPYISPIDVQLDCDEKTMIQPDVLILCHDDAPEERAVMGAPDFVLEVISPSTKKKDCIKKLAKYENAGVREYWILDPYQQTLLVYFFESEVYPVIYGISGKVPVGISQGELQIDLSRISEWVKAAV